MKFPEQHLAFDEVMIKCTSSRCPIRKVLPNKPIAAGIKLSALGDKATGCTVKVWIDAGRDESDDMDFQVPHYIDYYVLF